MMSGLHEGVSSKDDRGFIKWVWGGGGGGGGGGGRGGGGPVGGRQVLSVDPLNMLGLKEGGQPAFLFGPTARRVQQHWLRRIV